MIRWLSVLLASSLISCGEDPAGGGPTDSSETTSSTLDGESNVSVPTSNGMSMTDIVSSSANDATTEEGTSDGPASVRGAVSFHVVPKEECSLGDTWVEFPEQADDHPVSSSSHASLAESGTRDTSGRDISVTCQWLTEAEPFEFVLAIAAIGDDAWTLSMSASLAAGQTLPNALVFQRADAESSWSVASPEQLCLFGTIEVDIASQTVWGTVTCPAIANSEGNETCEITEGYFYFENCAPRML